MVHAHRLATLFWIPQMSNLGSGNGEQERSFRQKHVALTFVGGAFEKPGQLGYGHFRSVYYRHWRSVAGQQLVDRGMGDLYRYCRRLCFWSGDSVVLLLVGLGAGKDRYIGDE
ncbi:hypothetical protein PaeBR_17655 [Paenibacillus sp. BR2-3]|uniref:hypothetical protein n=1 Tax=Paenibacillus sp. BR2-3 TaxID=3048494 RepID=UPI0039779B43